MAPGTSTDQRSAPVSETASRHAPSSDAEWWVAPLGWVALVGFIALPIGTYVFKAYGGV